MKKVLIMALLALGISTTAFAQDPSYTKIDKNTVAYTTVDSQSGQDVVSEYQVTKDSIILKSMYLAAGDSPTKFKMNRDVTKILKPSIKEKLYEALGQEPVKSANVTNDKNTDSVHKSHNNMFTNKDNKISKHKKIKNHKKNSNQNKVGHHKYHKNSTQPKYN